MESKWTPGPWIVTPAEDENGINITTDDPYDPWYVATARRHIYGDPEKANAYLIAAAPELYEALRTMVNMVTDESRDPTGSLRCPNPVIDGPAVLSAIALLKKARGGS